MTSDSIETFFNNLRDRSITVCEGFEENEVFRQKSPIDLGYCFYRKHEGQYANDTGKLFLSWGSYSLDHTNLLIVVEAIIDEAKACKLDVNWKGSMHDRIVLDNLEKKYFGRFSQRN
jgi:hypothetical protein